MSNAPPDSFENSIERVIRSSISWLMGTCLCAASRLMRDSSLSGLYGLMSASMRCISSITALMAERAAAASSCHSSTRTAVPMIASSREYHSAGAGSAANVRRQNRMKRMAIRRSVFGEYVRVRGRGIAVSSRVRAAPA